MTLNLQLSDQVIGVIVLIMIFVGFASLSHITESFATENVEIKANWAPQALQQLSLAIREFGLPNLIDVTQGGMSVWKSITLKQRGFCWDEVIVRDDPQSTITINYIFPLLQLRGKLEVKQALDDLVQFNPAVTFNQLDQTIQARAPTVPQTIILLTLAKRLLSKEITSKQANNLVEPLMSSIDRKSEDYDPNAFNKFKIELCSLGMPLANSLGELPSSEIFTLRPGAQSNHTPNMGIYV
jgi:hypothetical protein